MITTKEKNKADRDEGGRYRGGEAGMVSKSPFREITFEHRPEWSEEESNKKI